MGGLPLVSICAAKQGTTVARLESDRVLAHVADPDAALAFYTFLCNVLRKRLYIAQVNMPEF